MNASTAIDLSKLSLNQLADLQKQVAAQIPKRRQADIIDLRKEILANIIGSGFTPEEVLGTSANFGPAKRAAAEPKYQSKSGDTWTGRGRKPAWVVSHLAGGGKIEDLAI